MHSNLISIVHYRKQVYNTDQIALVYKCMEEFIVKMTQTVINNRVFLIATEKETVTGLIVEIATLVMLPIYYTSFVQHYI